MTAKDNGSTDVFAAAVTRRQFVKSGGMLAVGVCMVAQGLKGRCSQGDICEELP